VRTTNAQVIIVVTLLICMTVLALAGAWWAMVALGVFGVVLLAWVSGNSERRRQEAGLDA
jgi:hypothetical protein